MDFTVGVVHFVADVGLAAAFLETELRFTVASVSDGEAVVENGALCIRLRQADEPAAASSLELEVTTHSLARTSELLEKVEGIVPVPPDRPYGPARVERLLDCPHGIRIRLVREYNEDELGIIPPLPTSLRWHPRTLDLVGGLLTSVPLAFREAARSLITRTAEGFAVEDGDGAVDTATALRAVVLATPRFQHPALRQAMSEAGLDAESVFESAGLPASAD